MTALAALVATSEQVGATSARRGKIAALATFLATVPADELELAVHYLAGELPQGRVGIGYASLERAADAALAHGSGLTLTDVDRSVAGLAALAGVGAAARREQALRELFARAGPDEQQFLVRLLLGELRQGALGGLMLDAIAAAAELPVSEVRRAAMYAGSLGAVARAARYGGREALRQFQLRLFAPLYPMLAQTAADVGEALQELPGELAFEWKLDGARIQVHRQGAQVRVYTRSLNEVTTAVPEVVELVRQLPALQLVLDGEAIALDPRGRPHPFQVTMRRFGRRLKVEELRATLPLRAFFFDCLLVGAKTLVDQPAAVRFAALDALLPEGLRVPRLIGRDESAAQAFYAAALTAGHEGVMAKALAAPYEAGNRGASWLKIKRAHTLDLVVLAAEWGHGRRRGTLSNLHLGALEPASGEYVMLGKTFKGLTDALLTWQTQELLAREIRREGITVHVRPELVVEIAFSDLQASPRYPGGLALRLARVKRYRADKRAVEADTMESVRRIYRAQAGALGS